MRRSQHRRPRQKYFAISHSSLQMRVCFRTKNSTDQAPTWIKAFKHRRRRWGNDGGRWLAPHPGRLRATCSFSTSAAGCGWRCMDKCSVQAEDCQFGRSFTTRVSSACSTGKQSERLGGCHGIRLLCYGLCSFMISVLATFLATRRALHLALFSARLSIAPLLGKSPKRSKKYV